MATKPTFSHLPLWKDRPVRTKLSGRLMLVNPFLNKGTCFTHEERHEFGLHGLLPTNVQNIDQQVARAYQQYSSLPDDLAKNNFMTSMAEQNTVLYHRLIQDHIKEMFSIIYTPTEGEAIENYSRTFRRPDGCFLTVAHPDEVEERMSKFVVPDQDGNGVDYIVVSDGEEILGIGDQGIGGILISVAKLALTTICAGIHPDRTLPVVLDTGTDNEQLLKDDLYLGVKHPRVRGQQYDELVENFVRAANKLFPNAYIHFEDFGVTNARRLLDRYRGQTACFNDDIQGTGCVTLAAIMAALKISNVDLTEMRLLVFGSGSAGCGIAEQVQAAIAAEADKSKQETKRHIWCVDRDGVLLDDMDLSVAQKPFARAASEWRGKDSRSLQSIIAEVKPHVLIGTSTKAGAFSQQAVEEMAKHVDRPIIFPLSNPTKLHEAQPGDINKWTHGKALIATGSPFPPVEYNGQKYEVAECNNSVCFPGIGLGVVLCRAKLLSDKMLAEGVRALAGQSPALEDPSKGLVPDVDQARTVSVKIAMAVIRAAQDEGLARTQGIPKSDEDLQEWIKSQMWEPVYKKYEKARCQTSRIEQLSHWFGIGAIIVPSPTLALYACPDAYIGTTAALSLTSRFLGGSIGTTIYYNIFNTKIETNLPNYVAQAGIQAGLPQGSAIQFAQALTAPQGAAEMLAKVDGVTPEMIQAGALAARWAFADSLKYVWYATVPFGVICMICCAFLPNIRRFMTNRLAVDIH